MSCKCIRNVNGQLLKDGHNCEIDVPLQMNFDTGKLAPPKCKIALEKRNKKSRKALPVVIASYCPFCGKKYDD